MSTFERVYKTDASRETSIETEKGSIELSDQEYLRKADLAAFIYRKRHKPVETRLEDAKSESEKAPSKPKKNHRKSNKATVEDIQEKL